MATVPHVTSGSGLRKFQSDGFLSEGVYCCKHLSYGFTVISSNVPWRNKNEMSEIKPATTEIKIKIQSGFSQWWDDRLH
jgi:hypothetical protein